MDNLTPCKSIEEFQKLHMSSKQRIIYSKIWTAGPPQEVKITTDDPYQFLTYFFDESGRLQAVNWSDEKENPNQEDNLELLKTKLKS